MSLGGRGSRGESRASEPLLAGGGGAGRAGTISSFFLLLQLQVALFVIVCHVLVFNLIARTAEVVNYILQVQCTTKTFDFISFKIKPATLLYLCFINQSVGKCSITEKYI